MRALPVDDKLVVHILPLGAGAPPSTVELDINKYSTPSTGCLLLCSCGFI